MRLKDQLKQIVRRELVNSGVLPSSKYRISTVVSVNSDGTCVVFVDGASLIATPLYPVVQGQEVMVVLGDSGKFSAIPTSPNTPQVEIIHPPFFSGGSKLRFNQCELINSVGPLAFRIQEEKSSNLYRFLVNDITQIGGRPNTQLFPFAPHGRVFGFEVDFIDANNPHGTYILRSYNIGAKLSSAGVIDQTLLLFTLSPPTLLKNYFVSGYVQGVNSSIPKDVFITDSGDIYFITLVSSASTFQPPAPLPDFSQSANFSVILESYNFNGFRNSMGLFATTAFTSTFQFHLQEQVIGVSYSGLPSWLTITASSGTINIPGLGLQSYDHLLTASSSGLAAGLYTATVTVSSSAFPGQTTEFIVYLAVNASGQSFFLNKVLANNNSQVLASLLGSAALKYNDCRILDPTTNQVAFLDNNNLNICDVIDLTGGNTVPKLSLSSVNGFGPHCLSPGFSVIPVTVTTANPDIFIRRNSSSGVVDSVNFLNASFPNHGKGSDGAIFTGSGGVINDGAIARKFTISGSTGTTSGTVQDISPGQADPTKWRQIISIDTQLFSHLMGINT